MKKLSRHEENGRRDGHNHRSHSRSSIDFRYKRRDSYKSSRKKRSRTRSRSRTYSRSPEDRGSSRRKRKTYRHSRSRSRSRSRTYSSDRTLPPPSRRKSRRNTSRFSRTPPKSYKYDASDSDNLNSLKNMSSLGSLVGITPPTKTSTTPSAMSSEMMKAIARHTRSGDNAEPPPPGVPVSPSPPPPPPATSQPSAVPTPTAVSGLVGGCAYSASAPPPTVCQPATVPLSYIPMPPPTHNGIMPCYAPAPYAMPVPPPAMVYNCSQPPPAMNTVPTLNPVATVTAAPFTPFMIRPPGFGLSRMVTAPPVCFVGEPGVPPPPPPEEAPSQAIDEPSTSAVKTEEASFQSAAKTNSVLQLPLPNVSGMQRDYEKPVILNKRKLPDVSENWGVGYFSNYKTIAQVGEGTYGQVYKALRRSDGRTVALKRVRLENEREGFPITAVREIKILRQLDHRNVVKLFDIVTDQKAVDKQSNRKDTGSFYLVFEYVDHDLNGLLDSNMVEFSELQTASIFKQLLLALEHCHNLNFLHRDIKCANILINNKGELKLADFGLARIYLKDVERLYTNRVITLWYRPPELLLGQERYGTEVDIWSAGCILGELFWKKPIFQGNVEHTQLEIIAQSCGSPSPEVWPDVVHLPNFKVMRTKTHYQRRLKEKFAFLPKQALDLFDCLLQLDPHKRPSATEALNHPWLSGVDPDCVPALDLPKNQDCHEMWSKKLRVHNRNSTGSNTAALRHHQHSGSSDRKSMLIPQKHNGSLQKT